MDQADGSSEGCSVCAGLLKSLPVSLHCCPGGERGGDLEREEESFVTELLQCSN